MGGKLLSPETLLYQTYQSSFFLYYEKAVNLLHMLNLEWSDVKFSF